MHGDSKFCIFSRNKKKISQDYSPVSMNHEKTKETVVIKVPFHKVSVISECTQIIFQLTYDII